MSETKSDQLFTPFKNGAILHGKAAVAVGCVELGLAFAAVLVAAFIPSELKVTLSGVLIISTFFGFGLYTTIRGTVEWVKSPK